MKNIFVYCELEDGKISDVSLELMTKGRHLADDLGCLLEAVVIGYDLQGIENQLFPYGADIVHIADDKKLKEYLTLPHAKILIELFRRENPQIVLFGGTPIGRDVSPRVASALKCGLTADCTELIIGDYTDPKTKKEYKNLLYQIRPAFGGNILATIINPDMHPQMATVREGVMKKAVYDTGHTGKVVPVDLEEWLSEQEFAVKILDRKITRKKINLTGAPIIVAGGYGVGSKENFEPLFELARLLGGEVAGTRAAVDAGFIEHERQVGQTGVTVRPKLYIACGISGAVQHRAGMDQSAQIISINTDPDAPLNQIADYTIVGDLMEVVPKMIEFYAKNTK